MGFINFVKNAGNKLFGRGAEEPIPAEVDPKVLEQRKIEALVKRVKESGIGIDNLAVAIDGDVATVSGTTKSQANREKIVLVVGNTHGIAKVDDQIEVNEPEPEAVYYTVVSGDSLSKIAKVHYGNAMKYPVIFEANKPMLTHPDKIYPGQMLRIPPLEK